MEQSVKGEMLHSFFETFEPPWSGSIDAWANKYVSLPNNYAIPGQFHSPAYLVQPFADFLNRNVEQINLVSARQTFKSGFTDVLLPYIIVNDPGPILRVHQSIERAGDFAQSRIIPLLQNCSATKPFLESFRKSVKKEGIFLPHMAIKIAGPSENYQHGYSVRFLFVDELHLDSYERGSFNRFLLTTTAFVGRRKTVVTSTPGKTGDQLSEQIARGHVFKWAWQCPKCKRHQPWFWNKQRQDKEGNPIDGPGDGITWDKVKNKDGTYNYEATGATARLECCHCRHVIKEQILPNGDYAPEYAAARSALVNGKYVCVKDDGDPAVKTYMWPAFVNPQITFKSAVIRYLQAKVKYRFTNNDDDLITFQQQVLGEEFDRKRAKVMSKILVEQYDANKEWPEEAYRLMAVDYQRINSKKYFVIRAFDAKGNSRQIAYGHVNAWDEIERIQKENNVLPQCTLIDCGYQQTENEVYIESVKRGGEVEFQQGSTRWKEHVGWLCLKGDGKANWKHTDGVTRYFTEEISVDTSPGLPLARLYMWSNYSIKNILAKLRDGQGAVKWATNKVDNDYISQMHSEMMKDVEDPKTGLVVQRWKKIHDDNHYWDCEAMILVGALMLGIPLEGV